MPRPRTIEAIGDAAARTRYAAAVAHVKVTNQRVGGWWLAPLRLLFVVALWLPLPATLFAATQVSRFASELPDVPHLDDLRPSYRSNVETLDGVRLGGAEATQEVPYTELPPHVVAAVIAAEDENFFMHQAFSARAIARAVVENYRLGRAAQGASTITQQVARQFLDSREKSYQRKIDELLLARRIEANFSKSEILSAYIGSVFWGHTAHGVTQASWQYFGKDPRELDLGEAALLAGLLPSPSRYSPRVNAELAARERARVLRRMHATGMISQAEVDRWSDQPVTSPPPDEVVAERLPSAFNTGLRFVTDRDERAWANGGITAVVPHDPLRQHLAERASQQAVLAVDRRQGWRGVAARAIDVAALDARLAEQPEGRFALARVTEVDRQRATVATRGGEQTLDFEASQWAVPADQPRHYKRPVRLRDFAEILTMGDVVFVDFEQEQPALAQPPTFEVATVAVESQTGRLLAAVGAFDAARDQFDRVFQGCRQPGSVFKPIVFAEAISRGLTAATMLSDMPTEVATGRGDVWRPRNADRDFKGYITLANALAWSRNIPTVNLMDYLGPRAVVARAKQLGVTQSRLDTTSSVSLGASCMRPVEVAQVYATFQRGGRTVRVAPVAYWVDAQGAVRDDALSFAALDWDTGARLSRFADVKPLPDRGVSEPVAYIMTDLLRRVVTNGTAADLPRDWQVAGKTGTTNEFDAWFVGFDGHVTIATWIGADQNRVPLGRGEHGATVALPAFAALYEPFARTEPYPDPQPPDGVEHVKIDVATGLLTPPGEAGTTYPFLVGSAPTELSPTRGTKQGQQIDQLLYDF